MCTDIRIMLLPLLLMSMFGPVFSAIHFSELVIVTVFFASFVEVTVVWSALFLFLDFRFFCAFCVRTC